MKKPLLLVAGLLAALAAGASDAPPPSAAAAGGPLLARDGHDAAVFRGSLVYGNYCVTCHGANADGNGRAARLYDPRPTNLRTGDKPDEYIQAIIRIGGEALGRSQFMPPWGAELTDEQIRDVTSYIRAINARP